MGKKFKKPFKVYPINRGDRRKIGDTIIAIGELTDKQRGEIEELFGISSNANHRSKTMKMLDGMNIKYEKSGRNGLVIKGVPKNKQQDLLNKIKKDVGMYNTATKEELEEDRKNALAGFDNRIRDGGMDRKDFIKAKELYKRKDIKGLRKHIYSLDTSPLEVVMNLISIQDRPFFDKMYPNTRGGEFLAKIAYDHRKLDENLDENKDDEKKRMKGAKLKLKMGETIKEENIRVLVKDVKDRNFIKDLTNKAKQLKVDYEKGKNWGDIK